MRDYLLRVYKKVQQDNLPFLAASISFFALFSLFPLVLFLIAGTGYFFAAQREAEGFVLTYVGRAVPRFLPLVRETIHTVTTTRGQVTVIGALTLLWAGTAVFDALEYALSLIWGSQQRRIWKTKIIGIGAVIILGFMLLVVTILEPVVRASRDFVETALGNIGVSPASWWDALLWASSLLLTIFIFWLMYRFVPNAKVSGREALLAAGFAGVTLEAAKRFFSFYFSATANFTGLYGSLGVIVGLMVWLYLTSMIVLIGGELAVGMAAEGGPRTESRMPRSDEDTDQPTTRLR